MYEESTTPTIAKKRYSFKKGYLQVSLAEKKALQAELMSALGITSRYYFSTKLNKGIVDISVNTMDTITNVFKKYGIRECWEINEMKQYE